MPGWYGEAHLNISQGHNEHVSVIILEQRSANSSLQPYFRMPCTLRMVSTFLKSCNKNKEKNMLQRYM